MWDEVHNLHLFIHSFILSFIQEHFSDVQYILIAAGDIKKNEYLIAFTLALYSEDYAAQRDSV